MLKGYFDESGIHAGSPVCIVAGFVADTRTCRKLSWDWQTLLAKYQLKYFHAKEYANRGGQFRELTQGRGWSGPSDSRNDARHPKAWDEYLRRDFENDAIAVINESEYYAETMTVIGAAVKCSDFFSLSMDHRRWLTGGSMSEARKWKGQGAPKKPYFLSFQQVVLDAVKFTQDTDTAGRHLGTGEMVYFVFDQQNEYEHTAKAIFDAMKRAKLSIRDRIGEVIFTSKERAIPLQVADFIAYESYSYLKNRIVHGRDSLRAYASWRLMNRERRTVFIEAAQLAKMLINCPLKANSRFTLPDPVDDRFAMGLRGNGRPCDAWW